MGTERERTPAARQVTQPPSEEAAGSFSVVGIGASAGGIEALKEFFIAMPPDDGVAFVVVQHLEPKSESRMAEILAKCTKMKVVPAADGMPVEPNSIFTNPPGRALTIRDGRLVLSNPAERVHVKAAIDHFLTSLAEDQGPKAVCIIMSGSSGSDGPRGVRAVRASGGICMVQEPSSAQFDAMPQAAIDTGLVDYVLPPGKMPAVLRGFVQHSQVLACGREEARMPADASEVEAIFNLLRARTNSDFRNYKQTMVVRRIQRRMGLRQIETMGDYIKLLQNDTGELTQLAKDMLIGVSSFFRDVDVFKELCTKVIAPLVQAKKDDVPLRAWIPGCATGEESYSIAMLLLEARSAAGKACPIQVFATDVDEQALVSARSGTYPLSIAGDVPHQRLEEFFTKQGQSYHVNKHLREVVVFSRHNVLTDPPFSRLDLVTCRNVLIYLEPVAQKKVLTVFSLALNVGGHLLLGRSEGVDGMDDLFEPVSKQNRIYRLARSSRQVTGNFPPYFGSQSIGVVERAQPARSTASILANANLESILKHFDASAVLVDPKGDILYFHGQTEKYLGHPKGPASLNILDMTKGILSAKLRRAIDKALEQDEPISLLEVPLPREGAPLANLTVMKVADSIGAGKLLAVILEDANRSRLPVNSAVISAEEESLVVQLEAEVKALHRDLRSNAEEYDSANEELKTANEEMMSMNEELQSANEELEASKEELQSLNEELTTVNSQVNDKVTELTAVNNDLANLLGATEIATIFLDGQLRIRSFTPRATDLLNLMESDRGRPVSHITPNFTGIDLAADSEKVLKSLLVVEKEVQTRNGRWYTLRILPYRTLDNRIDGAVVTFFDISSLKKTENELRYERTYAQSIVETIYHPLIVLDDQLRVLSANPAFYRMFQVRVEDCVGQRLYDLGNRQWDIQQLRDVLPEVVDHGRELEDSEVHHEFPSLGWRTMLLNARRIEGDDNVPHRVLLAIEDVTQRKTAEAELHSLAERLARSNRDLEQFASAVSHDLLEPLRTIMGFLELLRKKLGQDLDEKSQQYISFVMEGAQRMQAMITDLLEYSRLGRDQTTRTTVDLADSLNHALKSLKASIEQSGAKVIVDPLPSVLGHHSQLVRLFQNLIGNAIKFRREEPMEIRIGSSQSEEGWLISVRDNGIGIDMQSADRVFEIFQRLHPRNRFDGTGIGLSICKKIVQQHGGRIWLESEVGKGTIFYFTLPAGTKSDEQSREMHQMHRH